MNKSTKKHSAFTLIELLISIVILIVGLVGVLIVIPVGQRTSGRSAVATGAAIVAKEKFEELKLKGFDELTSQADWNGTKDKYDWQATVSDVTDGDFDGSVSLPSEKLVKITMTVSYKMGGKDRTDTFVTFYSEL